jgi:hypothetical protein
LTTDQTDVNGDRLCIADWAKASFASATGDWRVQTLDLANGRRVGEWQNGYVWGRLRDFVPGYPETFVLEVMDQRVRFDQKSYNPKSFWVVAVNPDFTWQRLSELPVTVRPRIVVPAPNPLPYEGTTWRGIWEIAMRTDADGSTDIELQDGRWLGYSPQLCPETMTVQWFRRPTARPWLVSLLHPRWPYPLSHVGGNHVIHQP